MKQLKIKDNSKRPKKDFSGIEALTERIADKTLGQLEREGVFVFPELFKVSEDITEEQVILRSENDSFRSSNVMGFIGSGNERLTIESRFSGGENDFFFQYLLYRVLDFPNLLNMKTDADQEDRLFNFLLFLFPLYLKSAMRKGLYKTYIRNLYNDMNVKGTIDIARHIAKNTPFAGNIAYSRREYSYDNSLMELVRHTIEYIKRKPYGRHILAKVKDEVALAVSATPLYEAQDKRKIVYENERHAVRHAYFREYRALQRLCVLILRREKHRIGLGTRQIYGILFDGAWLWEEYVSTLTRDIFYHPRNKRGEGAQQLFHDGDKKTGRVYPDFISRDNENRTIADAKYKPAENIGNRDYLQALAYMLRFDAKTGYYFYPEKDEAAEGEDQILRLNRGVTYEKNVAPRDDICVIKHGLKVPGGDKDYDTFAAEMKKSEKAFRESF